MKAEKKTPVEIRKMVSYLCEQTYNSIGEEGAVVIMVEGRDRKGVPFISCAHRGRLTSVVGLLGVGSDMIQESAFSDITENHASVNNEDYYEEPSEEDEDEDDV